MAQPQFATLGLLDSLRAHVLAQNKMWSLPRNIWLQTRVQPVRRQSHRWRSHWPLASSWVAFVSFVLFQRNKVCSQRQHQHHNLLTSPSCSRHTRKQHRWHLQKHDASIPWDFRHNSPHFGKGRGKSWKLSSFPSENPFEWSPFFWWFPHGSASRQIVNLRTFMSVVQFISLWTPSLLPNVPVGACRAA